MMTKSLHLAAMDRMIDQLDNLHSAPYVAYQVLTVLQDEDFDTGQLVQCLEADPALATSVLRLVNSSYFGLARNVSSLRHAIMFLGSRSLRLAVLNFGLLQHLVADSPAEVYQDFWRRAITMAAAGSRLAARCPDVAQDVAYSAGLLAELGVLVFSQMETDTYVRLYERVGHGELLVESERERFGFHHGQVGARLLDRWNLPTALTEAVSGHHESDAADDLGRIVQVASMMADVLWTPDSPHVQEARRLASTHFQLELDDFITLAVECREIIEENAELYNVDLAGRIDCEQLLERARRLYMEEAMEAAMDWDSIASVTEEQHGTTL